MVATTPCPAGSAGPRHAGASLPAAWALAVVLAATAAGCTKGGAKKIARDRDAAPVVVINRAPSGVVFIDEAEPNGSNAEAGELALPGGVRGSLDGAADVDIYRVRVATAGFLAARLSGIEGVDLILELRDGEGKPLVRSDRGPAEVVEGFPNVPVIAGDYWLAVSEFVKKSTRRKKKKDKEEVGRTGPSPIYELVVEAMTTPVDGGEVEPNEGVEDAGELALGGERFGYVGWNDDQDLWRLPLSDFAEGYCVDLEVTGVPVASLEVDLVDDEGKPVLRRKAEVNQNLAVRNLVPLPSIDHFTIRLSARRSNPLDPYTLRAVSRLLDLDEEVEPNDDPGSAMALREDSKESAGSRRGNLGAGDIDSFRLEPSGTSMLLTVSVEPAPGSDVVLDVATLDGASLGQSDRGKDGVKEDLVDMPIAAGTGVVLKLSGKGDRDQPYLLRWSVLPDTGGNADPILDEYR